MIATVKNTSTCFIPNVSPLIQEYFINTPEEIEFIYNKFDTLQNTNSSIYVIDKNFNTILLNVRSITSIFLMDGKALSIWIDYKQI